ncbi:PLP-dependent aminotransferase family protein [Proteus hauseri]|uniref:MocR-like pyridoxine biosynthesis transcription factor PdxR n=1 Tax=Proteus hauseri TaxID=183417 RepID=UPI001009494A|nr:PLP-dependent aminotransferase family protein [Proteus hauseri]QAV23130.1 PLP-dependent aminotransferase family protein [Proteus hauseri]
MKQRKTAYFPNLVLETGPIGSQVYQAIRKAILDGRLTSGSRLPSSRTLAEMMSISRNSVITGFERLIDEGYLVTRHGAGTFVAPTIPDELIRATDNLNALSSNAELNDALNPNIQKAQKYWSNSQPNTNNHHMFHIGVGCVDLFPHELWGRLLGRVWRQSKKALSTFNSPMGYLPLREMICQYVQSTRGLHCQSDQIIIVNGTQQAINLTARVLLKEGDKVWLDDPGYDSALGIFTSYGAKVCPIASDLDGMNIEQGIDQNPDAKLVFTTPSHQFPLGNTLSLTRRIALLEWASKNNVWVFEDDYNSEFRYHSKPIQALQGLDKHQRVIYAGTFSKMMYPGFRLGFLVVPPHLVSAFEVAKYYTDSHSGFLEQATLALFISQGHYARHVRRIRKACYDRYLALKNAIETHLPHVFKVEPTDSGIHIVCWLQAGYTEEYIIKNSKEIGLAMQPLSRYCIQPYSKQGVLLGYAAHNPIEIESNIIALAQQLS